jgi:hypothetical protein
MGKKEERRRNEEERRRNDRLGTRAIGRPHNGPLGLVGGAIDCLNLYPEEENRINPRILSDKRLTNYTISSIIKIL